jgi:protease-4
MRAKLMVLTLAAFVVFTSGVAPVAAQPAGDGSKVTFASIKISGSFPETTSQIGLFGELGSDLRKMIERLDKVATGSDVSGVILKIRSPVIGRGKLNELWAAIQRVRKSGKKVYADLESASAADYLIATACDEIVMPPGGMLLVTGVRMEVMFYQKLLEKLNIKADFIQMGDFKGAAEPFMRTEMSPELRKQYESLVGDLYDQLVTTISESRGIKPDKVKALIDQGLFTAADAKAAGLIDRVSYEDDLKKSILKDQKAKTLAVIRNYGKKKLDTDFSGFTGMIKLMNMMMGIDTNVVRSRNDKIAVVYAVGPIFTGESQSDLLGSSILGSETIVKALRKANKDPKVKAIVLRVDSPGGSAIASDQIWREVVTIEKPFIASMGDVAASGGYYISMGADKIFVEPGTITGSIGVVGGKLAIGGLFEKVGITTDVVSIGKNNGIFSTEAPFSPSERKAITKLMEETYEQFTTKAAEGRKMKIETVKELAQGKIYTGRQAKQNGLADELGTLRDAIAAAKKAAGLGAGQKVDLEILPKPTSLFEQMFGGPMIESRALDAQVNRVLPEAAGVLRQVEMLRRMFDQPVNTVLPYQMQIK